MNKLITIYPKTEVIMTNANIKKLLMDTNTPQHTEFNIEFGVTINCNQFYKLNESYISAESTIKTNANTNSVNSLTLHNSALAEAYKAIMPNTDVDSFQIDMNNITSCSTHLVGNFIGKYYKLNNEIILEGISYISSLGSIIDDPIITYHGTPENMLNNLPIIANLLPTLIPNHYYPVSTTFTFAPDDTELIAEQLNMNECPDITISSTDKVMFNTYDISSKHNHAGTGNYETFHILDNAINEIPSAYWYSPTIPNYSDITHKYMTTVLNIYEIVYS